MNRSQQLKHIMEEGVRKRRIEEKKQHFEEKLKTIRCRDAFYKQVEKIMSSDKTWSAAKSHASSQSGAWGGYMVIKGNNENACFFDDVDEPRIQTICAKNDYECTISKSYCDNNYHYDQGDISIIYDK